MNVENKKYIDGSGAIKMMEIILGKQKNENVQILKDIKFFEWNDTLEIRTVPAMADYDPCVGCPNNPKNGGTGICNCMLPYLYRPSSSSYQYESVSESYDYVN